MKKLAYLGGAAGLAMIALLHTPITQAADHIDANSLDTAANKMADLNDVYAWMTTDGSKIDLALTMSPFDDGSHSFGASVQYVFHLTRFGAYPQTADMQAAGEESKVICTFTSNTAGQCWVVDPTNKVLDYVSGDFSATAGKKSAGGGIKVFAGHRSDPFFFNSIGFKSAVASFEKICSGMATPGTCPGVLATAGALDAAGCPKTANKALVAPIAAQISATYPAVAPCAAGKDCFAGKNVMAIVVELDRTLVTTDAKKLLGVWASSHMGQ